MIDVLYFVGLIALAVFLHEIAHVVVAKHYDWDILGASASKAGSFGMKVRIKDPADIWKVALAGPMVSGILCLLCLPFIGNATPWVYMFAVVNAAMLFFNMLPFRPADGGWIFYSLKERRRTAKNASSRNR